MSTSARRIVLWARGWVACSSFGRDMRYLHPGARSPVLRAPSPGKRRRSAESGMCTGAPRSSARPADCAAVQQPRRHASHYVAWRGAHAFRRKESVLTHNLDKVGAGVESPQAVVSGCGMGRARSRLPVRFVLVIQASLKSRSQLRNSAENNQARAFPPGCRPGGVRRTDTRGEREILHTLLCAAEWEHARGQTRHGAWDTRSCAPRLDDASARFAGCAHVRVRADMHAAAIARASGTQPAPSTTVCD